ncbi:MAG: transposase family protein [Lachnospiraceae bacterium]|nr:transposase family protein [Lachnospiraceae bacterium]
MGREQERIAKRLEKNAVEECNRIQKKFYPELFERFGETKDPRNRSYTEYSNREMLGTLYYKCLSEVESMRAMTRTFNADKVVKNLYGFMGSSPKEYLPHHVTLNEYLERLEVEELENIRDDMVYKMIRRKTFDDAKVLKHWLVLIDGTELDSGYKQKNGHYLERCYNHGTEDEIRRYHRAVLEAKLYLGNGIVVSIGTETIENDEEYIKNKSGEEERKQDCELKAFKRLVQKLKKKFPRLPICIVADGLYVRENVLELCENNHWKYIIRYKEGCAKSIEEEYRNIPEKEKSQNTEYVNGVIYKNGQINMLVQEEKQIKNGKEQTRIFKWITNFEITKKNAVKIARGGRVRWKIENQGFNRQKHWQGNLEHACSWNAQAQKNHYLMQQIADFMRQLYEYFYLKKNEIEKVQKNIPSDILKSFGELTTSESISQELQKTVLN